MRKVLILSVLLVCRPGLASDPGQPLDCSDWVFLEPGLSCTKAYECIDDPGWCHHENYSKAVVDNNHRLIRPYISAHQTVDCSPTWPGYPIDRFELLLLDGGTESALGYLDERCGASGTVDKIGLNREAGVLFDPTGGSLYLALYSSCVPLGPPYDQCNDGYGQVWWVARIDGFPTLYEVLQTYEPVIGTLSAGTPTIAFRVPYMPEGFPAADYFDTYWGDLATVGNWSEAQPLQCGFPASPPSVGDYIEVPDPLPEPEVGRGRYYVTAVTLDGQRRYGRKRIAGVLSGRDPVHLPVCPE